jgi:protein gp37
MAENSKIEWTHHTFNPWWGCTKVSPGCKHCYAEAWARRLALDIWGKKTARRFFSDSHWANPIKWDRIAGKQGVRARVFCASMADVFEDRVELSPWREKLWSLIEATPNLDWLLLTKRPQRVQKVVPWSDRWPDNVWLGTTTENQKLANERIPYLLSCGARVRFLSCEPLIGPIDLSNIKGQAPTLVAKGLHWIIAGGESGARARPMNPNWVRCIRDYAVNSGISFHFKQWGHWGPASASCIDAINTFTFSEGGNIPEVVVKLGKHATGRALDGRTWDQFPIS